MKTIKRKQNNKEQNNTRITDLTQEVADLEVKINELQRGDPIRDTLENVVKKKIAEITKLTNANNKIAQELQFEKTYSEENNAELTDEEMYAYFLGIQHLLSTHKFGLLRAGAKYFEVKNYTEYDKKRGMYKVRKEVEYFAKGDLSTSFLELGNGYAVKLFREALEGLPISSKNPATEKWETFCTTKSVYYRFVNTLCTEDPDTMNLIDLSEVMKPQQVDEAKLDWIFSCLFDAIGGQKPENKDWLLKWVYGVVYANIGDPLMSFPVIYGEGKVGRNALFDMIIPTILGRSLCQTGTWDTIDSNFNQFKLGKVFTFIDELPERADWNKIKNQSGSLSSFVKVKYGPEFEIDNCIISAYGGNSRTYPLPLEEGRQMSRVSPIYSNGKTFAQLVYEKGNELNGDGYMEAEYKRILNKEAPTTGDYMFEIGDKYLRNTQWANRDNVQNFLNYLHKTYSPTESFDWTPDNEIKFALEPLRATDWAEILEQKKDPAVAVIEFLMSTEPDYIINKVAYEMYSIAFKKRYSGNINKKSETSFGITLSSYLDSSKNEDSKYTSKRVRVDYNGEEIQANVWFRNDFNGKTSSVSTNRNEYIADLLTNGRVEPTLKVELTKDDDSLFETPKTNTILEFIRDRK